MKEIIIPLSREKITLVFLGSLGFVALSFWLFQISENQTRYDQMFVKVVSVIGIVIFGLCGIYAFTKFFDKKPGLVINDEGIIDNSSAVCVGLIKWENITNVSIADIYGQKILTIDVNNADEIVSKQQGFKKLLLNLNKYYLNSPIHISSNALKCNFKDLYNILKEQLSARHIA